MIDKKDDTYTSWLFDEVDKVSDDQELRFQLRGDVANVFIDAAMPLFGLSLRVRSLARCDNVSAIYKLSVEELKSIDIELSEMRVDPAMSTAYRYVLCTFLDEAVMGTEWGASSVWAEHSMLSRFHQETWGGEKVFSILERLEAEPKRYLLLLEFIYHCLILGFEGKYRVIHEGSNEREKVISRLYFLLIDNKGMEREKLISPIHGVITADYKPKSPWPIWSIVSGFLLLWTCIYLGYNHLLNNKTVDVLTQLNQIL